MPVNTDIRYITAKSGVNAIPRSWMGARSLCEFCAARGFCETYKMGDRLPQCESYIPPLTFRDRTGLHHKMFSTIRLGKAWHKRLYATKSIVALVHKTRQTQKILGFAESRLTISADKKGALTYSDNNHLLKDREGTKQEKLEYLNKLLRRYYGGFDQDGTKPYTVIVLRRLNPDEDKRLKASWPVDKFFRD